MHQFIYWTNSKLDLQHQRRYYVEVAESDELVDELDHVPWIYKDYDELKVDLLGLFGRNKIIDNVQWLVLAGYLKRRTNPKYRWDKTLQYAVDVDCVQSRIDALPSFKNKLSSVSNQTHESGKNKSAIPENTTEKTTKKKKEKETTVSAVADAIYVPSNSDDWDVAQDASDSAMFSVEGQKQNSAPAEKVKRPMSAAVSPSPLKQKMGEKSSEATASLSPIPGGPLSLTAPIETMSPLDSNETAIDTAKKESPAQAAQRINVESLVACGYAQPITTRGWSNFKNVLKTLTEASITHDLYADFHRWVKLESANQGAWDVTLNSLAEKNRPERYMDQRAKKAIRDAQSTPQLSTTPMGAKNAYSKRNDPAYAYLYPTPDERTNAK